MRVAVVAPPWLTVPPVAYGGTEAALDVLCRGLTDRGHEVLLATTGDAPPLPGVESVSLFAEPVGGLAAGGDPASEPALVRTAEIEHAAFAHDAAVRWGADIVHDHTVAGPGFGAARHLAGQGPPVVTTHHGPFDDRVGSVFIALSHSLPVIALSRSHALRAGKARIEAVIHHGVDLELFRPRPVARSRQALFVGRISPDKGIDVAIHAARRSGIPLVIAAKMRETAERDYFARRISPLLGDGITYVGEADRSELVDLMSASTCLLNPIDWDEPFGLVAIEALACGLPVVATPRGAMPELIVDGRTGFLRSSLDGLVHALAQIDLIDRSACRAHAVDRFSMDRVAADHEALYRRLAGDGVDDRSTIVELA
jgi:glycosyltransferase involved in cell wall biosynthesis